MNEDYRSYYYDEEPPRKNGSHKLFLGLAIGLVLGLGAGIWFSMRNTSALPSAALLPVIVAGLIGLGMLGLILYRHVEAKERTVDRGVPPATLPLESRRRAILLILLTILLSSGVIVFATLNARVNTPVALEPADLPIREAAPTNIPWIFVSIIALFILMIIATTLKASTANSNIDRRTMILGLGGLLAVLAAAGVLFFFFLARV